jgi:hypothetical protein
MKGNNRQDNCQANRRLVIGAARISEEMYGDPAYARRVYHLASYSNAPIFRHGSRLAAWDTDLHDYMRPKPRHDDDDKNGA